MHHNKVTYFVHGFRVPDKGKKTVKKLFPYFSDYSLIVNHFYRRLGLLGVLWSNKTIATLLADRNGASAAELKYAVGHSNGCPIIVESIRRGAEYETILLINPALKALTEFPEGVKKIVVIHTKHDKAVRAARFFNRIPFIELIIPDAWGAMGAVGYKGRDPRVVNVDMTDILDDHSDLFSGENLNKIGAQLPIFLFKGTTDG